MIIGQKFNNKDRNDRDVIKSNNSDEFSWSNYGFSRDLSRIIFSKTFRRLGGKTQVFPVEMNEHAMNRMTHTLVVNNIAMDIATRINFLEKDFNINLDLIQAMANGHDVGHTPFGHAGERKLDEICSLKVKNDMVRFKHNFFSIDILQNLDRINDFQRGYDLAWQTIDGILKHTELPKLPLDYYKKTIKNKFLFSDIFSKNIKKIDAKATNYIDYPYPLTIEGQIVKAADEIAQNYHDMLDWSRNISHDEFVSCIKSIQACDIRTINMKDRCQYVSKFLSMFFEDDGTLKESKINDRYNRGYFAWGIKELMINDIVCAVKERINDDSLVYFDVTDKTRFFVKNILFVDDEGKIKINFCNEAVKIVSNNINDFGKSLINSESILQYDLVGEENIQKAFNLLSNDEKLFIYHCKGTVLTVFSECCKNQSITISVNGNSIIYQNYDDLKRNLDDFTSLIFKKTKGDNGIVFICFTNDEIHYIANACVIKCLARMTDKYIKKILDDSEKSK